MPCLISLSNCNLFSLSVCIATQMAHFPSQQRISFLNYTIAMNLKMCFYLDYQIKKEQNESKLYYSDSSFSLLKDVIQVPDGGYVILRTRLDNPGTFIFHCHIDFHLSIGMGMVLQIGEFEDWNTNTGPLAKNNQHINKICEEEPPSPIASES